MYVRVQGTAFVMGSNDGSDDERPAHRVWVDAFAIAAHSVTNAEYARFAQPPHAHDPLLNHPDQPVVAVSWHDAMRYCSWLGDVRLPTEAEWELAARGGVEGAQYPWGDDAPRDCMRELSGPDRVGHRAPNGFGLYDMCENVHEWCADWYSADYYGVSPLRNPRGPDSGTRPSLAAGRGGIA